MFQHLQNPIAVNFPVPLLANQIPVTIWATDRELKITLNWGGDFFASSIPPDGLVGHTIGDYIQCADPHTDPVAQHHDALRGVSSHFEFSRNGRVTEIYLEPLRGASGEIIGCLGLGLDITERKKSEELMRYQATHDGLTGLANYREFLETLEREVRRAERSHHSFAVILLDLDDLKQINDSLGHLAGNRALKRLAEAMKAHCRSTDLAARYGGDEFAVVLLDSDPGMARQIAERVESALREQQERPSLSVSIGVSIYPDDGRSAQELLETADQRLYRRKFSSKANSALAT